MCIVFGEQPPVFSRPASQPWTGPGQPNTTGQPPPPRPQFGFGSQPAVGHYPRQAVPASQPRQAVLRPGPQPPYPPGSYPRQQAAPYPRQPMMPMPNAGNQPWNQAPFQSRPGYPFPAQNQPPYPSKSSWLVRAWLSIGFPRLFQEFFFFRKV